MKMKNLKVLVVLPLIMFSFGKLSSQVTIGSSNPPSPWSLLDLDNPADTDLHRALHLPRLDNDAREALTPNADAQGLMIFNTDTRCLEFWNSTEWISLCTDNREIPPLTGRVWELIGGRYVFDIDTIPQELIDCINTNFGSIEAYKQSAHDIMVSGWGDYPNIRFFYYYDETRYWLGLLFDGADEIDWSYVSPFIACWRWTDETETAQCVFYSINIEGCSVVDPDCYLVSTIERSAGKMYITEANQTSFGQPYCSFDMRVTTRWELVPVEGLNSPTDASSTRALPTHIPQNMPFGLFRSR